MTVAINARAAVRREIGGVERLAREMAARLPRPPCRARVGAGGAPPTRPTREPHLLPRQPRPAGHRPPQRGGDPRRCRPPPPRLVPPGLRGLPACAAAEDRPRRAA